MKYILLSLISCGANQNMRIVEAVMAHRHSENEHFRDKEKTILTAEDFEDFAGLEFYPIDLKYRVKAKFVRTPAELPFLMPTTTDRLPEYVKYGEAHFSMDGKELKLALYQSTEAYDEAGYEDYLFLLNQRSLVVHNNCESIQDCMEEVTAALTWIEVKFQEYTNQNHLVVDPLAYNPGTAEVSGIDIAMTDPNGFPVLLSVYNQPMENFVCSNPSAYTDPFLIINGFTVSSQTPTGIPLINDGSSVWGGSIYAITLPVGYSIDYTQNLGGFAGCYVQITRYDCTLPNAPYWHPIDYMKAPWTFDTIPQLTRYCNAIENTVSSVNRYSQLDDIYTLLQDPFNKTKHTSPISTINGGAIDVYTDETFYVPKVKFTYLKKPRTIDGTTGSVVQTDLPNHTHQEIVDMAVSSILEGISDPRYQSFRAEEIRSE